MIELLVAAPLAALGFFATGTVAHELTHWGACRLLALPINYLSLWPPEVSYDPATRAQDDLVKIAPILVSLPILVAYAMWASSDPTLLRLLAGGFVVGYLPRSGTDWAPVSRLVKSEDV